MGAWSDFLFVSCHSGLLTAIQFDKTGDDPFESGERGGEPRLTIFP